jgi:hypothetical protein
VAFSPQVWHKHRETLENLLLKYPTVTGHTSRGSVNFDYDPPGYYPGYIRDNWGCLWHNVNRGNNGHIIESPLENWANFDSYKPPDYLTKAEHGDRDWNQIKSHTDYIKSKGKFAAGNGERLFDRLYFLRGFENLMIDIAEDHPKLPPLIEMLLDYEMKLTKKWLSLGIDAMNYHTDIQ